MVWCDGERRLGTAFVYFPAESGLKIVHAGKLDFFDAVARVAFVTFLVFVGVVVPEDGFALRRPIVEGVVPPTRVL
jgi:hypothetical protein